jgi:hypothetical protein
MMWKKDVDLSASTGVFTRAFERNNGEWLEIWLIFLRRADANHEKPIPSL